MSTTDWLVLFLSQLAIVVYGIWRSRKTHTSEEYFKSSGMSWFTIGISVMATQASAITFLSAPGQAFYDGMRFVQFYLGLPLAMILISAVAVPMYKKLNVYTAYEYLETRFNVQVRVLTALLFLLHRGLAAGFTIFAPSLVLSAVLGWDIVWSNIIIGSIVILYTVTGGTKAVAETQKVQMFIIFCGMVFAAYLMLQMLPGGMGLHDALTLGGKAGKMNVLVTDFAWNDKYNLWSGLIGGGFLALSYFGTDQSQVSRYLTASSVNQSRMGLLFNAIFKIPMQFFILLIGVILYCFFLFNPGPAYFNPKAGETARKVLGAESYAGFEKQVDAAYTLRKEAAHSLMNSLGTDSEKTAVLAFQEADRQVREARSSMNEAVIKKEKSADLNDTNYVFFYFVKEFLPIGMLGLIISVIFSASMSSTSSELNALSSSTSMDIYRRLIRKDASPGHYLLFSRLSTLAWGIYAIIFACFANRLGSLIEAVNVVGSLVYGTILGIFLAGFLLKWVQSRAVMASALLWQTVILGLYLFTPVPFLWYNVIAGVGVPVTALLVQVILSADFLKR
jgi:Na+/proline symporter